MYLVCVHILKEKKLCFISNQLLIRDRILVVGTVQKNGLYVDVHVVRCAPNFYRGIVWCFTSSFKLRSYISAPVGPLAALTS